MLPEASDSESARQLRDVVALSTLPAVWLGAEPLRMAECLAAALFTTLGSELVYVCVEQGAGEAPVAVAQIDRYRTDATLAQELGATILDWARTHDPDELLQVPNPFGAGAMLVATRALGFDASLGVVAAGFVQPDGPTPFQQMLLGIGANQAASAVNNAQLVRSLRKAQEDLRDADRRKDEFLATLSHELRNPLAPLRNSLEVLRLRRQNYPWAAPIHEMMERQVGQLIRLVDDLLEISRITRGSIELRKELVDVGEVLRSAVETSEPLIRAGNHHLSFAAPSEPVHVEGDPVRLAQVFSNLLNNAARYTDAGGEIRVTLLRDETHAKVSIADTGVGLAPANLSRIFEMFTQLDQSTRRHPGGLGIGLALVKRLVDMHHGLVEAHSEGIGRGSEFIVRLPLAKEAARCADLANVSMQNLLSQRILVVDDNRDAADSLCMLLGALGADVRSEHDGSHALDAFETFDPAVVLLDIGMPGMDGFEVARRIRNRFPDSGAAIIALTGWGQEADRQRAREAGFDHHLTKPVDIEALQILLIKSCSNRYGLEHRAPSNRHDAKSQ